MKRERTEFIQPVDRRNLIIYIDRVLVDVIPKEEFETKVNRTERNVVKSQIRLITLNEYEFYVLVRPGTEMFLETLRQSFTIHIVTHYSWLAVNKLLPLIDPKGISIFPKNITCYTTYGKSLQGVIQD